MLPMNARAMTHPVEHTRPNPFAALMGFPMVVESHFQPIFGLAHRHTVGFEALLRVEQQSAHWGSTRQFLEHAQLENDSSAVDCACLDLHLAHFGQGGGSGSWLFLNVLPESFVDRALVQHLLPDMLSRYGLMADNLVLEVERMELDMLDAAHEAAMAWRDLGCLLAVSQFGRTNANLDSIWRLRPDIVKLDQSLVARAAQDGRALNMLRGLVSLLHDAGSLVVIEGIESHAQAMVAMQADCDFVQGFYFGMPQADIRVIGERSEVFDRLWNDYRQLDHDTSVAQREKLAPYIEAFRHIPTRMMMDGQTLAVAAGSFLDLPAAALCFVLDSEGRQIGEGLPGHSRRVGTTRLHRLQETAGASWIRRPYFRDAMHALGELQVSRPYLSASTGRACVTLSIAFESGGQCVVLCGDLDWEDAVG